MVLDACVLVPVSLADTLLRIAERELYRPLWSARIVAEAVDAVVEIHPELPPEQVQRRFADMDDTFEDARIDGWEDLEDTVTLPDPDDRHVVATAVHGRADAIVTANLRDYPPEILGPLNIEVIHPTTSSSISWTSPRGSCSRSYENRPPTPGNQPSRPSI
ncbi:MAG TPA: PIN domain-containing protein [Acidimicrobiales bacterium]|nr:PIN domain-containing protein [Acidimicrobiales bacterium]